MIDFYVKTIWGERLDLSGSIEKQIAKDRGVKFFHCDIIINNIEYHIVNIPFVLLNEFDEDDLYEHLNIMVDKNIIQNNNIFDYDKWLMELINNEEDK